MATIKDVADLAGVSLRTAMRALSGQIQGKRRDARERARRVQEAAHQLNYHPSEIAKALRNGKTRTLGLVVGSISNRYFAALAETVLDEAEKFNYRVIFELTRWSMEKCNYSLEHLQRLRVDGIFYAAGQHFPQYLPSVLKLRQNNFPMVMLYPNQCNVSYVTADHNTALPQAIKFLASKSNGAITFAYWQDRSPQDQQLVELFLNSCQSQQLESQLFPIQAREDMGMLLKARPRATIIHAPFCLKHFFELKKRVRNYHPAVVGIYDEWSWFDHPRSLAGAILLQSEQQIRQAVRELIRQIEQGGPPSCAALQSVFYSASEFKDISAKDLSTSHLFSF